MLSWIPLAAGLSSGAVRAAFLPGLQNVWKSLVSFVNPAFQPQQDLQLEEKEHIIFITQMVQACL